MADIYERTTSAQGNSSTFIQSPSDVPDAAPSLKRRASDSFDDRDDGGCKRAREASPGSNGSGLTAGVLEEETVAISGTALADDLAEDLMCGCCSALLYRPVVVNPCQHYFCGSCLFLWVRNGGTSCPACRTLSTSVTSSRVLQLMIDVLLRHDPARARTERERAQADAVYKSSQTLRIPPPRELSPEPSIPPPGDFVRPCPHCAPGNRYGWTCPQRIQDPTPENGWHVDEGAPPGHAYCGNCENLLALPAPTTSKCDFCQTSFCGIGVQGRCVAAPLVAQHPHGLADLADLVQSAEVYDTFGDNAVEVDIMFDYLTERNISPRAIYCDVVEFIRQSPRKFAPLIEVDLFADVHSVAPNPGDTPLDAPRNRICRGCAAEVLLWGLRDWWIRERRKGHLPEHVAARPDCSSGLNCRRQSEHTHCKEFNHIIAPAEAVPPTPVPALALPPLMPDMTFLPLTLPPIANEGGYANQNIFTSQASSNAAPTPSALTAEPPAAPPTTNSATTTASALTAAHSPASVSRLPLAHVPFIANSPPPASTADALGNMMQHLDALHNAVQQDLDILMG